MLGLGAALLAIFRPDPLTQAGLAATGTFMQCVPAAVVALFLFVLGGRGPLLGGVAMALVLYPRITSYSSGMLKQAYSSSHVLMARARGLSQTRVLLWHALPVSLPQLISFAGVSVSLALSASIPMEVILDTPGIGQLAWQAALARDMSLLVALTICFSLVIVSATTISEVAMWGRSPTCQNKLFDGSPVSAASPVKPS
jgi:ABC-type dipeptide/oligopeptide/nickel transport system permease component